MISWHKPGQWVALRDGVLGDGMRWSVMNHTDRAIGSPQPDTPYQIASVHLVQGEVCFVLKGMPSDEAYDAQWFRPIYPGAIEDLRRLPAPARDLVDA